MTRSQNPKELKDAQEFGDHENSSWHLVQIKPNMQAKAQQNLRRQGIGLFIPFHSVTQRRAGRFVTKSGPLFPGYIFVSVSPDTAPWRQINSTYGVSRLVSFSGLCPAKVPTVLIRNLMAQYAQPSVPTSIAPSLPPLVKGDKVEIQQGPFSGLFARMQSLAPGERIWVLLDLLGRETRVCVPRAIVAQA
jgi:transcriptional antiterminator RfaH